MIIMRQWSIRTIILVSFTIVLLLTMVSTLLLTSDTMEESLRRTLYDRGNYLSKLIAEKGPFLFNSDIFASRTLQELRMATNVTTDEGFVGLLNHNLTWAHSSEIGVPGDKVLVDLRQQLKERGDLLDTHAWDKTPLALGNGIFLWAHPVYEREGLADQKIVGYAVVALSDRQITDILSRIRNVMVASVTVGLGLFLILLLAISKRYILTPLFQMSIAAKKISSGDLCFPINQEWKEKSSVKSNCIEFRELQEALSRTTSNLRTTISRVQGVCVEVPQAIARIAHTGEVVAQGAATTSKSLDDTSHLMEEMTASLRGIAQNVEALAFSADESSSSILKMTCTNDEVAESVRGLAVSVEETSTAIEQMTFSLKEVAKNIEQLSTTTGETSTAMNDIDISISQVEMNANETARLSELVSEDAAIGVLALQKTLHGIDRIKDSSKEAADVIENLGNKIGTIGKIINVIDEIADQTNLLALNAAIIAAQAGDHGKGFAVVADEIKELAEKTGASTKEINELVTTVQDESKNAIRAMERGIKNVEEGVYLGGKAGSALTTISESASKATVMVKAIARVTVEQARGSKQVTSTIHRMDETVQQIAQATAALARSSDQVMKSAEKMKGISKQVERSSQEQTKGSRIIARSIEKINEMIQYLNCAQKDQTNMSEDVMLAVESIQNVMAPQCESIRNLEKTIDSLRQQTNILQEEIGRFRV